MVASPYISTRSISPSVFVRRNRAPPKRLRAGDERRSDLSSSPYPLSAHPLIGRSLNRACERTMHSCKEIHHASESHDDQADGGIAARRWVNEQVHAEGQRAN